MFRLARVAAPQVRLIHTTRVLNAVDPTIKKSFKRVSEGSSKAKKGQGKDKSFKKVIQTDNFHKFIPDHNKYLLSRLPVFNPEAQQSQLVRFPKEINQKLHIAGALKKDQFHELFSEPITIFKAQESRELLSFIERANTGSTVNNKLILTGNAGVGKSTVLTQFQSLIDYSKSILIPFTNTDSLFDGTLDFKLNPTTGLYGQPMFTKKFLRKFRNLNDKQLLSNYKLNLDYTIIAPGISSNAEPILKKGVNSLYDLVNLPFRTTGGSSTNVHKIDTTLVFDQLFKELTNSTNQIPTYLSVDNFTAFTHLNNTKYRKPDMTSVHVSELAVSKTLLDLISSEISFPKGGIILATSALHKKSDTIELALKGVSGGDFDFYGTTGNKIDFELANRLASGKFKELQVSNLSVEEIDLFTELMLRLGMIYNQPNLDKFSLDSDSLTSMNGAELRTHPGISPWFAKLVSNKYLVSSSGNPRAFINSCVLSYV